jgi:nicotinamide-nucleotide amidase
VGMVCFAWAARGEAPQSRTFRFSGGRSSVRRRSVALALRGLLDLLR